jgi:hypothetical protein
LHAWQLSFIHPNSGKEISVYAPLPEDLKFTLNWLQQYFDIDTDTRDLNVILSEENHN